MSATAAMISRVMRRTSCASASARSNFSDQSTCWSHFREPHVAPSPYTASLSAHLAAHGDICYFLSLMYACAVRFAWNAFMPQAYAMAGKPVPPLKYHCVNRIPYAVRGTTTCLSDLTPSLSIRLHRPHFPNADRCSVTFGSKQVGGVVGGVSER
jgi:hypothetical protein